jgi:hypothetical protein
MAAAERLGVVEESTARVRALVEAEAGSEGFVRQAIGRGVGLE